jgi:hypothetical protein
LPERFLEAAELGADRRLLNTVWNGAQGALIPPAWAT